DFFFFFQAEDGIRDYKVTGVQTCALPISGFGTQSKGAELLVNQPATINFALSVQESKTTVEVTTEAQTINATDATIGNSVSNTRSEERRVGKECRSRWGRNE